MLPYCKYSRFTSKYVSPVLCTEEISSLDTIDKKDVNFTVSDNMENSTFNAVLTTFYIKSPERMSNLEIICCKLHIYMYEKLKKN